MDAEAATYIGAEGWATYFARMDEVWDDWRVENVEIFDADGDRVAAVFHIAGTGKASGIPVERAVGLAYSFRDGKLWRMRSYWDPQQALEAVGLLK